MPTQIISKFFEIENSHTVEVYEQHGGYETIQKVLKKWSPQQIIEEVTKSNLRGLGGAGFPTGRKWSFIPRDNPKPRYLVVNADESEPGTFKDRYIMDNYTHGLLEGIMIASYAIGAHKAFIYIRGEYVRQAENLVQQIAAAYQKGYLGKKIFGSKFDLDVVVHRGAGAYICGEETALLESLEGKKGWPRMKPPFPAIEGAFKCPTIVNNVETIAYVPSIISKGAKWFAELGSERNGGLRFFSVSGHVKKPGVYELPMGVTLREIIFEHAGGLRNGANLKAVVPGGSSSPVLKADEVDVKMDYDSLAAIGSMLGSAGVIVMDESTCMARALYVVTRFYHHESCGQCTPCREGTGWAEKILKRILDREGRVEDIDNLYRIAGNVMGNTICPLGDAAALPIKSYIEKFRDEFEYHVKEKKCDLNK
ncbi:MAG: NADH-quinone oxidoreductase subunit NuoF [bacterium]